MQPRPSSVSPSVARPSPPPNPPACLLGTWKVTTDDLVNTINGTGVQFTGPGPILIFRRNGTGEDLFGRTTTVLSAVVNGVNWTDTIAGTMKWHWLVKNGEVLYTGGVSHGTQTLRDDGVINDTVPLSMEPGAVPYSCSRKYMREVFPDGSYQETHLSARPTG